MTTYNKEKTYQEVLDKKHLKKVQVEFLILEEMYPETVFNYEEIQFLLETKFNIVGEMLGESGAITVLIERKNEEEIQPKGASESEETSG